MIQSQTNQLKTAKRVIVSQRGDYSVEIQHEATGIPVCVMTWCEQRTLPLANEIANIVNEHDALNAIAEAAQQIADFNAMSPDDRSAVQDGLGDQPVSEYNGHKLLDALATLAAMRRNGGGK